MKTLLLYRRGGLGDTLLTFPVLEIFKKEGYKITAVGNTDYFEIAKEVGFTDRVLSEIPKEDFTKKVIISYEGNLKPFPEKRMWIVSYYLESLGLSKDFSLELPVKPLENSPFKDRAVIHPSSGSPKKNPPLEFFLEIREFLETLGIKTVFLLGEAEEHLRKTLKPSVFSLSPIWIAKALKSAKLFVGLDSGISHLASYLGLPSLVIYGPTDPIVWKPIGKRVYQLSLNLECSPCFPNTCQERSCLTDKRLLQETKKLLQKIISG